jgi:large subunit ribosomal protein L1
MKITKNNKKLLDAIDVSKTYEPIEAIKILKENKYAKFDETLEVAINLGIDSNKTDQGIRGVTSLPNGTGKSINVAVLTKGDKQKEAKDAGADLVGENDLIESISSGKISFDLLIASPDCLATQRFPFGLPFSQSQREMVILGEISSRHL